MHLGEYIKQYRDQHEMTVREFAKRSGLSPGYISMLEKNQNPKNNEPIIPSIETFQKVALGMGTTIHEIMRHVDENQPVAIEYVIDYQERENIKATARNIIYDSDISPESVEDYYMNIFQAYFARSLEQNHYNLSHVDFNSYVAMILNQPQITEQINSTVLTNLINKYGTIDGSKYGLINGKTIFLIPNSSKDYTTISDSHKSSATLPDDNKYDLYTDEVFLLQKYRTLDEHGKETINLILDQEFKRCNATNTNPVSSKLGRRKTSRNKVTSLSKDLLEGNSSSHSFPVAGQSKTKPKKVNANGTICAPRFSKSQIKHNKGEDMA